MKKKVRIGIDYHGCVAKLPYPLAWYYRHIDYSFRIPTIVRLLVWKCTTTLPTLEDKHILECLKKDWNVYIISGTIAYKKKIIRKLHLYCFIDDQLAVIRALNNENCYAIDIREVRKTYAKKAD